jgi:sugar phosphate isomerase/epimerase
MKLADSAHLTYCTNIHPGEQWEQVRQNLRQHVAAVKARVCPDGPFGVGLWLSAAAARSLQEPAAFAELEQLLHAEGLYVFTLNGFPYGAFHGGAIKTRVYEPDWRDPKRLEYSNALATLLSGLLPAGVSGSISTLPGGYKPNIRTLADEQAIADNLLRHVAHLHRIFERTGKSIALALEPEPCCYIETIDEAIAFFDNHLRSSRALSQLQALCGATAADPSELLARHIGLCLDTCHAAVEYEQPAELAAKLRAAAIPIVKIQLSSGLRLPHADERTRAALTPYLDEVYLHQVVERSGGQLTRHLDLPDALSARAASGPDRTPAAPEWRVHFHVPIFIDTLRDFETTQPFLREILAMQRAQPLSAHLEVETYMWDVLPAEARQLDLPSAIARELHFCLRELGQPT